MLRRCLTGGEADRREVPGPREVRQLELPGERTWLRDQGLGSSLVRFQTCSVTVKWKGPSGRAVLGSATLSVLLWMMSPITSSGTMRRSNSEAVATRQFLICC